MSITDVHIRPLSQIRDERGKIMHMMRCDDVWFEKFGEIYFSVIYPNVIKGWHRHSRMVLNYAVIVGVIKLVLYDDREGSATRGEFQELVTGEDNYALVTIPPGIWNGFKGLGKQPAIVANCSTEPHDPAEIERLNPLATTIPYDWAQSHG